MSDLSQNALLIVDVQSGSFTPARQRSFGGMNAKNQRAYLDQLSEIAAKFRQQGCPVIWVTVGEGSNFVPPQNQSSDVKNKDQLKKMGWFGGPLPHDVKTQKLADDFGDFSAKDGPRQCDAAVMKMGFNTFNPNECGTDELLKYLEENGVKNLAIAGGNAEVCVTATALGAAINRYGVTVLSDQLLSDDNPQRTKLPQQYEAEMKDRMDRIIAGVSSINKHLNGEKLLQEWIDLTEAGAIVAAQEIQIKTSAVFFESQSDLTQDRKGSSRDRHVGRHQKALDPETDETKPRRRFYHRPIAQMRPR